MACIGKPGKVKVICWACQVLNLPESGDNVWHNLHWIVPAAARVHGRRQASLSGERSLRPVSPDNVLLILLFDGYEFREDELQVDLPKEQ